MASQIQGGETVVDIVVPQAEKQVVDSEPPVAKECNGSDGSGKPPPPEVAKEHDGSGISGTPVESELACTERWSPFHILKKTPMLGDLADAEDQKFGDPVTRVPLGKTMIQKLGQWPLMMLRVFLLSIPAMIGMGISALLPCYGDKDQTPLSAAIFGVWVILCGATTCFSVALMANHRVKIDTISWALFTLIPFCIANAGVQVKLHQMGKTGKGIVTQLLLLPYAFTCSIAFGKMHCEPGWRPKWNMSCCVCRRISKPVASIAFAAFTAFCSGLMLVRFLRQDTLSLAESKSKAMIVIRPTLFFVVKKLAYHAFAMFAKMRHPVLTKASNVGVSIMLGIASAILFSNTRKWNDLIFFVLGNWFTFMSKLWTLFGSKGATNFKLLAWYSWFMSTGKPSVAPGMNKQLLRGFEIQAQNFGTTFGLVVIVAFYPIAKFVFGQQSMIYKLIFATDKSLTFLVVALTNEVIEDNFGQLVIGRLTNNDFSRLYSFNPSIEVILALFMNTIFASVLVSSGFLYRADGVGPFKEVSAA